MDLLSEMVVFARVVESRGFAPAARQLGLTTSAVSRGVARLEGHLGAKLLNRTTRSVSLTELGAEIYPACARIAQTARDVHALAGHYALTPRGTLRVSAPTVFGEVWVAPQLPAFLARWPDLRVELQLMDRPVDLVDEGFDVAIRIALPTALPQGLVARRLFDVRYLVVAAPAYLGAQQLAIDSPAQLAGHDCTYLGHGAFQDQLLLEREGEQAAVQLRGRLTINNSVGILATVEAGLGLGVVPEFTAAEGLRTGRLQRVLPAWTLAGAYAPRPVSALYSPARHLPQKVRVLMEHLAAAGSTPN